MPCFLASIDSTGLGKLWKNLTATLQGIYNSSQWVVDRKHAAEQDHRNEQCIKYKGLWDIMQGRMAINILSIWLEAKRRCQRSPRFPNVDPIVTDKSTENHLLFSSFWERIIIWLFCSQKRKENGELYLTLKNHLDHWCETTNCSAVKKRMLAFVHTIHQSFLFTQ